MIDLCFVDLSPGVGGPQRSLAELAVGLRANGAAPTLIAARDSMATALYRKAFAGEVTFVEAPRAHYAKARATHRAIRRAVRDHAPDLVIPNTPTMLRSVVLAAPRRPTLLGLRNSAYARTEQLQLMAAAAVKPRLAAFAPSRFAASLAPRPLRGRVSVVPNPVDVTPRATSSVVSTSVTVGVVTGGRSPVKGADLVPRMVEAAAARPFRWRVFGLIEAGTPPGSPGHGALRALRTRGDVELVGRVPFTDRVHDLDIVLVVSRRESFGRVAAESMAAGKAVVAPSHTGLVETLDEGRAGLLYTPEDPESAAAQLIRLHDHPELRVDLGERAAASARERFAPVVVGRSFLEVATRTLRSPS